MQNQINELNKQLDETDQSLKQNNIKVVGFPEIANDNDNELAKQAFIEFTNDVLGLNSMSSTDIEQISRMGKPDTNFPRALIVKFKTRAKRNKVYQKRKVLYNSEEHRSSSGIYMNEDLTLYRQRLYYDARRMRKEGRIFATWTSFGNIMVKHHEYDKPIQIRSHKDLAVVLRTITEET